MDEEREPIDWTRIIIHGFFGVIVGGFLGLLAWAHFEFAAPLVFLVPLGAGIAALFGGWLGDEFWEWLVRIFRWCWWW
jgi:hypothetical protein